METRYNSHCLSIFYWIPLLVGWFQVLKLASLLLNMLMLLNDLESHLRPVPVMTTLSKVNANCCPSAWYNKVVLGIEHFERRSFCCGNSKNDQNALAFCDQLSFFSTLILIFHGTNLKGCSGTVISEFYL